MKETDHLEIDPVLTARKYDKINPEREGFETYNREFYRVSPFTYREMERETQSKSLANPDLSQGS